MFAAILLLTTTAVAPQSMLKLDLICTLTALSLRRGGALPEGIPIKNNVRTHLRLDLEAKRWCQEECLWRANLEADDDHIGLKHLDEGPAMRWTDQISRTTGTRMTVAMSGAGGTESGMLEVSQCEPAPFTGFPATKF